MKYAKFAGILGVLNLIVTSILFYVLLKEDRITPSPGSKPEPEPSTARQEQLAKMAGKAELKLLLRSLGTTHQGWQDDGSYVTCEFYLDHPLGFDAAYHTAAREVEDIVGVFRSAHVTHWKGGDYYVCFHAKSRWPLH